MWCNEGLECVVDLTEDEKNRTWSVLTGTECASRSRGVGSGTGRRVDYGWWRSARLGHRHHWGERRWGLTAGVSKNQGYIDRLYGLVDAVYIDFGVLDYHVAKYECTGCCSAWREP